MALPDRIVPLCDLLLGAAFADEEFKDRERDAVREMLADLLGTELPPHLARRIDEFDHTDFDLGLVAAAFADDPEDDRKRVIHLVAAINDADDEVDFAEDDYLRTLARALALPESALAGLTIDVEVEELRGHLAKVRTPPPPPPGKKR